VPSKSWNVTFPGVPVSLGQLQLVDVCVAVVLDPAVEVEDGGGVLLSATNAVPSKLPMMYCDPDPTTPGGPPGLSPICTTHLVSASLPSRARGKMLGHSQTPPTAFMEPNSLVYVQSFRLGEV
jgi:hypothetical protein